jgi:hypothetical protein
MADQPKTLFYKRAQFVTHLPTDYLYSPSHAWIASRSAGRRLASGTDEVRNTHAWGDGRSWI